MIKAGTLLLEDIKRHAEREYPRECCGLLIGRIEDDGRTRSVVETYPVANAWEEADTLHRRMLITPQDYMRAERHYAKEGLGVVGNYHSHPDHPAVPSEFDLKNLAPWPTMSYVVVAVVRGRAVELRSWELEADGSRFNEEEILKGS
ncbi:MAG TPA: M67 family metallopeptidase [Pyrinomonadaceae bacterium]|nr:M67 family metallopeptidase [Pyrinomonadaceae bacterium]